LAGLENADGKDYIGSPECDSSMNADGTRPTIAPAGPTPEEIQAGEDKKAADAEADRSRAELAALKKKY